MATNQEIDALLQELGRLVGAAFVSSEALTATLERLFRQGYSVRLDGASRAEGGGAIQLTLIPLKRPLGSPGSPSQVSSSQVSLSQLLSQPALAPEKPASPFRLDAGDVAFLRSIGIDGTRRARSSRRA